MEKKEIKDYVNSIKNWLSSYKTHHSTLFLACSAGKDSMLLAHLLLEEIIELQLNEAEMQLLKDSAKAVKEVMDVLDRMNAQNS